MPGSEFQSVIHFVGDATQAFATIDAINQRIQQMGQASMGGGAMGGGNPLATGLTQTGQAAERATQPLARLGTTASTTGYHWEGMIQRMLVSMFVWQGVNVVMNTVGDAMVKVGTETSRLDDASARLSVTLGTSKEAAMAYAQAYSMMGAAYGMTPAESIPQAQYAARVARTPARQEEMFQVSAQLARVTGEDPKKLIDDLNVSYRQTGISITQLGDMSVKAWQNSGTSAGEYLNILREVGPLAISSGIDIERMAGIAAQAADRMGGSMSDAANTLTRLIKAVQQPNAMQFDVLTKYGIKPGGDVQTMLDQISKANMSAMDLAALGGRPGMPAVANDIRTMIAVFKEYNGELSKGAGLQEAYTKSTDSMDTATKKLAASWDILLASMFKAQGAKSAINELASVLMDAAVSLQALQGMGLPAWMTQLMQGATTGKNYFTERLKAEQAGMLSPYAGGMYQPGMQGQNVQVAAPGIAPGVGFNEGNTAYTPPAIVGRQKMMAGLETGAVELPTSATDISKYTQSQIDGALAIIPQMMESTLQSYRIFLEALQVPPDQIGALVKAREQSIQSAMEMYQSGTQYSVLSGAQAYFLKPALGLVSERDTKADKQKDLEARLKELTDATYESVDQQKKANQLQGMWNIPAGARILAPIAGGAMNRADTEGGGDSGRAAWERNRQKEIAKIQEELEKLKAEPVGGGIPPREKAPVREPPAPEYISMKEKQLAGIESKENAQYVQSAYDRAVQNSMATMGAAYAKYQNPAGAAGQITPPPLGIGAPGIGASDVLGKTITSAMSGLKSEVNVNISATPITLTSFLMLDKQVLASEIQKVMVNQVVDQARSTGFMAGAQ